MDKAIVKYLHERGEDLRGVAEGVDSPCMEKKGRCSRRWKIPRYHVVESCPQGIREDFGWKIRRIVECEMGKEQQGFRRGRGTADGMYTLRQLVEKKLEGQENMALGFRLWCPRGGCEDGRRHI